MFCLLIFLLLAGINVVIEVNQWRAPSNQSLAPIVGGIMGVFGAVILPVDGILRYWWVPILVDIGCGPYLLLGLIQALRKR